MGNFRLKKSYPPNSNTSPNNNRRSIKVLDIIIKVLLITLCSLQGKGRFVFPAFIYARCNSETWAGSLRAMHNLKRGSDYSLQAHLLNILASAALLPFLSGQGGRKGRAFLTAAIIYMKFARRSCCIAALSSTLWQAGTLCFQCLW